MQNPANRVEYFPYIPAPVDFDRQSSPLQERSKKHKVRLVIGSSNLPRWELSCAKSDIFEAFYAKPIAAFMIMIKGMKDVRVKPVGEPLRLLWSR